MRLLPANAGPWILSGIGLDLVALTVAWWLLNLSGAHDIIQQEYIDIIGLFAVPWLVHVILLPAVWRIMPIYSVSFLLVLIARSVGFLMGAALAVPIVGFLAGFIFLVPFGLVDGIVNGWGWNRSTAADLLITDVYWTIVASVTGAAAGLLLNIVRPFPARLSSDVVGAALAAFLAFVGMFIFRALDLFNQRPMLSNLVFPPIAAPYLSAYVAIGLVALLPHLVLIRTNPGIRNGPNVK